MSLRITPLHPIFGAELSGLDLREPLTAGQVEQIDQAMNQYAVVVFRDQALTDSEQLAFAKNFGPLEGTPAVVDAQLHRLEHKEMVDISNLDVDGSILSATDRRRMFNLGNRLWHSDSSFKSTPAHYSMLHARIIPPEGGETEFADMRNAWDRLPAATQARIEPLVCDHSLIYSRALLGFDEFTEHEKREFAPVPQRLVRRHPGSGRRSVYLSSHIGVVRGLPRPEGLAMIRDLIEHATERPFVYSHAWRVNDLVIWDNRSTMHRGRTFDDQRYKRDMRRLTLQDSAPTLEQAL